VRTILIILAVLLLIVQLRLWQEVREVRALRVMVEAQFEENARLEYRNEALAAEVEDLRAGLQAIEERARSELGLIREDEEFFLIIAPEHAEPEGR
jgi:cell division protein FtsB